jgi:hypothetical protein
LEPFFISLGAGNKLSALAFVGGCAISAPVVSLLPWRLPVIRIETLIHAPIAKCFDLSRDIDLHIRSTEGTRESAVSGVTSGLIGFGEEVTWEATHFLVRQRLTTRITAFNRPHHFRVSQVRGAFHRFDHDHFFFTIDEKTTRMLDQFD